MTNYKIVRHDPLYDDQICELEKEIWSPDLTVNKSYLQWKYFDNPLTDSPKIYMALHEGKVIAVRGMYETRWQLGKSAESFIALCAGDLVIHREYRNRGLYTKLMNFVMNDLYGLGYRYLFSFSAGPPNLINSLATGWKSIGRIRTVHKEFYPAPIVKKLMSRNTIKKFITRIIPTKHPKTPARDFKIYEALKYNKKIPPQIKIDKDPRSDEMTRLVRNLIADDKIVLTRDEKFYSWRYRNPLSNYIFLYWYDDVMKGYLVAQTPLYRYGSMVNYNVVELEAADSAIKMELLKALSSLLGYRSISIWSNMLGEDVYRSLLSKGFKEQNPVKSVADFTQTVLVRTTGVPNEEIKFRGVNLIDMNSWDLKMIYSDAF